MAEKSVRPMVPLVWKESQALARLKNFSNYPVGCIGTVFRNVVPYLINSKAS